MLLLLCVSLFFICITTNGNATFLNERILDEIAVNNIVDFPEDYVRRIEYERPLIPPFFFGLRNDSIFQVRIYHHSDTTMVIDSLVVENIFVPIGKRNLWICHYDIGNTRISKFKKYRHFSKEYLNANANSYWEAEMEMRANKLYDEDMVLIEEEKHFGRIVTLKTYGH